MKSNGTKSYAKRIPKVVGGTYSWVLNVQNVTMAEARELMKQPTFLNCPHGE